ncbi:class II histone deacetylase [Halomonas piscis]|uniref:Class II histone deacetylase n=1 Tax=Halomonas piscis TaxID=3031727 RepID=A0ABY9Z1P3_9GAMM|nr:class II histone deacetylase [Halomonas piscis]WNK21047.1 class II histone deacetylase [Halomonas piscis]
MNTGIVLQEDYFWYDSLGQPFPPFKAEPGANYDSPEVKKRFYNLLRQCKIVDSLENLFPSEINDEDILRVHSARYLEMLKQENEKKSAYAGPGAVFAGGDFSIARLSSGGTVEAVKNVLENRVSNAFALVRPPGHHAETDRGAGFCVLNNVAIAARYAQAVSGIDKVAIIDWDVHHGNGAQEIFWEDASVLTISLHQDYYFLEENVGTSEYSGEGKGSGYNINVPLPPGSGNGVYSAAIEQVVEPAVRNFEPDLIIVASGLDAGCYDPLGRMALTPSGFKSMTEKVRQLAEEVCNGRLVLSQEGGYDAASTPYMGLAVVEGLSGMDMQISTPFELFGTTMRYTNDVFEHHQAVLNEAAKKAKKIKA